MYFLALGMRVSLVSTSSSSEILRTWVRYCTTMVSRSGRREISKMCSMYDRLSAGMGTGMCAGLPVLHCQGCPRTGTGDGDGYHSRGWGEGRERLGQGTGAGDRDRDRGWELGTGSRQGWGAGQGTTMPGNRDWDGHWKR